MKISVVVNTFNEEKNLAHCLESVKDFGDELVVVDMHSTDRTVAIAKKFGANVYLHEYTRFVEPARNFALSKAAGDWLFILDADEELSLDLAKRLKKIVEDNKADYVEIPRKNIIFGQWASHSRWWPDFLVRFFKKGKVKFSEKIHAPPEVTGVGLKLEASEANAIIHYHYQSISQYLERLNRYTDIQAEERRKENFKFNWEDLITKPANEFFSRFFVGEGYKDGLNGLALAFLQAFSELVLYLKLWEGEGFKNQNIEGADRVFEKAIKDFLYWQQRIASNAFKKVYLKIKSKI